MADEADAANDVMQRTLEATLRTVRTGLEVEESGVCLLACCTMPLPKGRRWCDADCRDQWEREKRRAA